MAGAILTDLQAEDVRRPVQQLGEEERAALLPGQAALGPVLVEQLRVLHGVLVAEEVVGEDVEAPCTTAWLLLPVRQAGCIITGGR